MTTLSDSEHKEIGQLLLERFGIEVAEHKRLLLENRLGSVLRRRKLTMRQYLDQVLAKPSKEDLQELINQVSTNYTYFNREPAHFEYLQKTILPELTRTRSNKRIRMWCAAAATGEEPYMLMMIQREHFGAQYSNWDAGLLATDISEQALTTARKGIYEEEQVKALPMSRRTRHFQKRNDGRYAAKSDLRDQITFRRFNLTTAKYPFKTPFDVIFCRNVMIYFQHEVRMQVVERMHSVLAPGGYLFVGHAEALPDPRQQFDLVKPACYRRR